MEQSDNERGLIEDGPSGRDWRLKPPTNEAEAWLFAEDIAASGCAAAGKVFGETPRYIRRAHGFDIVWSDGTVTNQVLIEKLWKQ